MEWIKCSEEMPPDGVNVLVYYGDHLDKVDPPVEVDYATTRLVDYCDGTPARMVSKWTYKSYRIQEIQPTHWAYISLPKIIKS